MFYALFVSIQSLLVTPFIIREQYLVRSPVAGDIKFLHLSYG